MSRATFWSRYNFQPTDRTSGTHGDSVLTLQPGETLLRTVVSFDFWIDSTTTEWLDAGVFCAWALDFNTSATSFARNPTNDWSGISQRWYYIDQMIFEVVNAQVIGGSTSYVARNNARSRYTNIENQWRNDTGAAQYLWWLADAPPPIYGNSVVAASVGISGLIMVAP